MECCWSSTFIDHSSFCLRNATENYGKNNCFSDNYFIIIISLFMSPLLGDMPFLRITNPPRGPSAGCLRHEYSFR
jgi:hypothetical protein